MNIGTIAGLVVVAGGGVVIWKLIKKKCEKEVKVYGSENISYPKDKATGGTKPGVESPKAGDDNRITNKSDTGKIKRRKPVQVKSSPESKQPEREDGGADKTIESDSPGTSRVQPI